jgi:NAD(P)-dependent dehydrogenase (short-subunit alcohol dehydrogenase family)
LPTQFRRRRPEGAPEAIGYLIGGEGRGPDCLVHNAGKGNAKPITETSGGDLEFYLNHNLRSVFRLCSEDRNVMGRCDTMVNVASSFGMIGSRGRVLSLLRGPRRA